MARSPAARAMVAPVKPQPIKIDRSKIPELLGVNELKRADMDLGSFVVFVENNVTRDKVLRPAWWANHVGRLRIGAPVVVMRKDMTMVLELRVRMASPGMVKFIIMGEYLEEGAGASEAEPAEVPPVDNPEAYEVKSTPQNGYIVVFRATGAPISPTDKRFTQIEAIAWANSHNKQAFTS